MSARERPLLVIPGDDPVQIAGSPRLDTLGEHYEIRLFDNRPADDSEKLQRAMAEASNAETAVKAAEADWKKWTDSFETAGKNVPRDSAVAANN